MKFTIIKRTSTLPKTDCLIVPVFAKGKIAGQLPAGSVKKEIAQIIKQKDFTGQFGQLQLLSTTKPRVLLLGLGDVKELHRYKISGLSDMLCAALKKLPVKQASFLMQGLPSKAVSMFELVQATCCALNNSIYQYTVYKKSTVKNRLTHINFMIDAKEMTQAKKALGHAVAINNAVNLTRDLVNAPPSLATPTYISQQAQKVAKSHAKLTCQVLDEKAMRKLKMRAVLAVNQGSAEQARLIVLNYKGGKTGDKPVALVGKGVAYDSGGYSLKPASSMESMKCDMAGGASVIGTIAAIAEMKLPINVVGIVPAVMNMVSDKAFVADDIITGMSGTTIEVCNTDAEGRLILSDALTYAKKFQPKTIIDIATLTGAQVVALGMVNTGLYSRNEKLVTKLLTAAKQSGDKTWHMPLDDEYQKLIESKIADVKNVGGRFAGSITAACFLERFVDKKQAWAHLDVAGTAFAMGSSVGATGRPIPLLVQYLQNMA